MTPQPVDHIWWLASRASGIVAIVLLSLSVIVGLAMSGKLTRRPGLPKVATAMHEQLSVAALIAIGLHGVTLLGDPWLDPGVDGIAVPFAIGYRSAFVAMGIVGGYLAAALGLSFYARRRLGSARWRKAHRFVLVAWLLAFVHALGAGTDTASAWLRTPMLAIAGVIAALFAYRVASSRRRPAAPRPRRAITGSTSTSTITP